MVITDYAERTGGDTGTAAYAQFIIHRNSSVIIIPTYSVDGTNCRTEWILALPAEHWRIETFHLPFNRVYSGMHRIGYSFLVYGTYEFTYPASGTAFRVDS